MSLQSLRAAYKTQLLQHIIPFWTKHSLDYKEGGFFTCLDQQGLVYDTDKYMWLQWRQIWMFSRLYNELEQIESWRDIAEHGLKFAARYGSDGDGRHYFSLTRDGRPLTYPYNIYTECFAALAWNEYSKISNKECDYNSALLAFNNFIGQRGAPKGAFSKQTSTRPLMGFGLTMMSAYLAFEMEDLIGKEESEKYYAECFDTVLNKFYDPTHGVIRENINPDGSHHDSMDGRLINPGHGLEAIWFLMDIAEHTNQIGLVDKLCEILVSILDFSWDHEFGGIYYFMDVADQPPQQLEHDQKLWWVHLEALVALSRALKHRPSPLIEDLFMRVHNYTFTHFPDNTFGEWYGYLSRSGKPHNTAKGGKWKGCFHVPRGLLECITSFSGIEENRLSKLV